MWRGFAWQQEFHWKRVNDLANATTTTLIGTYVQMGYFLENLFSALLPQFELATRYAYYDPNTDFSDDKQQELSFAANWVFNGHLNKLTAEATLLAFDQPNDEKQDGWRYRLQWDISF
jgi:phosphate-selective porin